MKKNGSWSIHRGLCAGSAKPPEEEEGANKSSNTETFVAIRVDIDNWRWRRAILYLRTGKRLPTKCSEVVVYFKTPELNLFKESLQDLPQNKLTIRLQPDEA